MVAKGKIIEIIDKENIINVIIMNKVSDNKYAPICFTGFTDIKRNIA